MFEQMLLVLKSLSSNEEIFSNLAKIYYQFYVQLIAQGFTEEQAVQIVCASGIVPKAGN